jgi:hypothetical protein
MQDGYEAEIIEELVLKAEGIKTIIWATGYKFDLGSRFLCWIKMIIQYKIAASVNFPGFTSWVLNLILLR